MPSRKNLSQYPNRQSRGNRIRKCPVAESQLAASNHNNDLCHTVNHLNSRIPNQHKGSGNSTSVRRVPKSSHRSINGSTAQGSVSVSDRQPRPIDWLWPKWIAKGKLTLIAGQPGVSKSLLTLDLASRLSSEITLPTGEPLQRGSALIVNLEDDLEEVQIPRLTAAGADLDRIRIIGPEADGFDLKTDVNVIIRELESMQNPKLLIIDPLSAYAGTSLFSSSIRNIFTPYLKLAREFCVALLCVVHFNKTARGGIVSSINGSVGLGGMARSIIAVDQSPQVPGVAFVRLVKSNHAPTDAPVLQYRIETQAIGEGISAPRLIWGSPLARATVDHLLDISLPRLKSTKQAMAATWLQTVLTGKSMRAEDLFRLGQTFGHSKRTLERAKSTIGVKSCKKHSKWIWSLPDAD